MPRRLRRLIALFFVAAVVGPEGQCDYDNHDAYVLAAHRSGLALFGAALALAVAASLLAVEAIRRRRGRSKVLLGLAGLISFVLAGLTGFIASRSHRLWVPRVNRLTRSPAAG